MATAVAYLKPRVFEQQVKTIMFEAGFWMFHDKDRSVDDTTLSDKQKEKLHKALNAQRQSDLVDLVGYRFEADGTTTLAAVECKTGKAVPTEGQQRMIDAYNACPSEQVWGLVVWPHTIDELKERL